MDDDTLAELVSDVEEAFNALFAYNECATEETLIAVEDLEEQLREMKRSLYDEMEYEL